MARLSEIAAFVSFSMQKLVLSVCCMPWQGSRSFWSQRERQRECLTPAQKDLVVLRRASASLDGALCGWDNWPKPVGGRLGRVRDLFFPEFCGKAPFSHLPSPQSSVPNVASLPMRPTLKLGGRDLERWVLCSQNPEAK